MHRSSVKNLDLFCGFCCGKCAISKCHFQTDSSRVPAATKLKLIDDEHEKIELPLDMRSTLAIFFRVESILEPAFSISCPISSRILIRNF